LWGLRKNGEKIEKKSRKNRESAIVRRLEFFSARSKRLQPLDLSFSIEKSHFAHTTLPSQIIIGPLKLARPPTRLARKRSGVRRVSRVCGRIAALVFLD
jgi:hypothetical protein